MDPWVRRRGGWRVERTRHESSDMLPIMLRSAVYGPVTIGRFRQPWSRRMVLVKWVVAGEAAISVGGRRTPFRPGDVAVHMPTQPHQFWVVAPDTEMCWFSADGSQAEQFIHLLGLRAGVFRYGPAPMDKLTELRDSLIDQSLEGCRRASLLAIQMFYDMAGRLPSPQASGVTQSVRHLIREGLADPQLSAERIATQLSYNRGALSRLFHQQTGSTIMEYITRTRLQEAEMLLTKSEERIGDVARKCGFADKSYFTRWIRKHTGRLPRELRATRVDMKGQEDTAAV